MILLKWVLCFLVFAAPGRFYIGSRIRIFTSRIQGKKYPGSGSASKIFSVFNPKNCFEALGKIILDVHPESRSEFFPSWVPDSDPGVKKAPNPRSGIATLVF
jgi:hypothetical protein